MTENPSVLPYFVGSAGWNVPKESADRFSLTGTHLERYASHFSGVEINSSFYRPHRPQTYAKWAASVPEHFRFAVKVPKIITHERRLQDAGEPLERFLGEVAGLGAKLGPLLVQLPPSLKYEGVIAKGFFAVLRDVHPGQVVCEPRHPTWFTDIADGVLAEYEVARAAVDPFIVPEAAEPGGWPCLIYYRLHGSPVIYRSSYSPDYLKRLSARLKSAAGLAETAWCIFDNTAEGAAASNALDLIQELHDRLHV